MSVQGMGTSLVLRSTYSLTLWQQDLICFKLCRWEHPPPEATLRAIAAATDGYAGADLQALCTAAVMAAVRRATPTLVDDLDRAVRAQQPVDVATAVVDVGCRPSAAAAGAGQLAPEALPALEAAIVGETAPGCAATIGNATAAVGNAAAAAASAPTPDRELSLRGRLLRGRFHGDNPPSTASIAVLLPAGRKPSPPKPDPRVVLETSSDEEENGGGGGGTLPKSALGRAEASTFGQGSAREDSGLVGMGVAEMGGEEEAVEQPREDLETDLVVREEPAGLQGMSALLDQIKVICCYPEKA